MAVVIIDEVSKISAILLAELDMHLRTVMSHVNEMKRDNFNRDRRFGGVNILFVGVFPNWILRLA